MGPEDRIEELERELARLKAERTEPNSDAGRAAVMDRLLGDRVVLENLPDIVCVTDRDYKLLYLNRTVPGKRGADLIGKNVLDSMLPEHRPRFVETFELAWSSGETQTVALGTKSGFRWETRLVPIRDAGEVVFILSIGRDVTERDRSTEALRQSESRLRHAIEATGMGTWTYDDGDDYVVWDETLCRIFGVEPDGAPKDRAGFMAHVHPEDRAHVASSIERRTRTGRFEDLHHRIVRPSGEIRYVLTKSMAVRDANGKATGFRGGVFDMTDRKLLEEHLQHVQKMDAVGQLTAGIAHNFNNVLGIILPNVALCRHHADEETLSHLADIEHAANRAAEMVRQLLLFARPDRGGGKATIDLVATCRRTVEICRTTFDRKIAIDFEAEPMLPGVEANAGQIEQALLNVCLNARDALEHARTPLPRIVIRLTTGDQDDKKTVVIRVVDNGPGMDEATRKRIFEPFFTTKEVGRGTGLGLASAYAIVSDHGGGIGCDSRPGQGATFTIELPATGAAWVAPAAPASEVAHHHSGTALVIDDEPLVRRAVRGILERGGYRVIEAADGIDGLALYESERVDVIILDQSMPRLSGDQVILRLAALGSKTPVVLLSGNPDPETAARATVVLHKPASAATLLAAVRGALQERSSR